MNRACKPTVPLPDDAVDDFQKDILKPTDQVLFLTTPHDTSYHPINCEPPYPPRRGKVTVSDPSDSFMVMLWCRLNRHQSTGPLLDDGQVS